MASKDSRELNLRSPVPNTGGVFILNAEGNSVFNPSPLEKRAHRRKVQPQPQPLSMFEKVLFFGVAPATGLGILGGGAYLLAEGNICHDKLSHADFTQLQADFGNNFSDLKKIFLANDKVAQALGFDPNVGMTPDQFWDKWLDLNRGHLEDTLSKLKEMLSPEDYTKAEELIKKLDLQNVDLNNLQTKLQDVDSAHFLHHDVFMLVGGLAAGLGALVLIVAVLCYLSRTAQEAAPDHHAAEGYNSAHSTPVK